MHYVTNNSTNTFNWQNIIAPMRNVPFCSLQHLWQYSYFEEADHLDTLIHILEWYSYICKWFCINLGGQLIAFVSSIVVLFIIPFYKGINGRCQVWVAREAEKMLNIGKIIIMVCIC